MNENQCLTSLSGKNTKQELSSPKPTISSVSVLQVTAVHTERVAEGEKIRGQNF